MLSLTNSDIIQALPLLADFHEKADSGTTSTLVAATLGTLNGEEVIGSTLCILNGDLSGSDITVTDYADTNECTLTFATQTSAIDSTTVFGLVFKPFDSFIVRAESILTNEFRNRGRDINNFLTASHLKELHLLKTLELICLSKRKDATFDDIYHANFEEFKDKYIVEINSLNADYDYDGSGVISDSEELFNIGQVGFNR